MSRDIEFVNEEEIEETNEGVRTKVGGFMKRNGKKIVAGVAVVAGIGLAYVIGKKTSVVSDEIIDNVTDTIGDVADEVMPEV